MIINDIQLKEFVELTLIYIFRSETKNGIDDVETDNSLNTSKRIYDINGKCLPATSLDELPSGLYIVNGKKVVK